MTTRFTYSPSAWRLGLRKGELILQSGSCWVQGSKGGVEWSDVPTVNLDSPMTPLSPAAQAVMDAFESSKFADQSALAAALRAAADQVAPEDLRECETYTNEAIRLNLQGVRCRIFAIAAELEAQS